MRLEPGWESAAPKVIYRIAPESPAHSLLGLHDLTLRHCREQRYYNWPVALPMTYSQ